MTGIKVEHNPDTDRLETLGVSDWSIWTHEASEFPWTYDSEETCYFLEGEVEVRTRADGSTQSRPLAKAITEVVSAVRKKMAATMEP